MHCLTNKISPTTQADKSDPEQPSIASVLTPFDTTTTADVAVVGCGPAGLALSAELAAKGLNVALVGLDVPFVNNYGVWLDEFKSLGIEDTLDFGTFISIHTKYKSI